MSKKTIFRLVPSFAVVAVVALILFIRYVRADDASCPPGQTLTCSGYPVVCKCEGENSGTVVPTGPGPTSQPGSTQTPGCGVEDWTISIGKGHPWWGTFNCGGSPCESAKPNYCYSMTLSINTCDTTYNPVLGRNGKLLGVVSYNGWGPCGPSPVTPTPPPPSPCKKLYFDPSRGTVSCEWKFQWELQASVGMPPIVIDARPYPVTLVKWPTAMRVNALASSSGSGTLNYAGWGGGIPSYPAVGDWRDITLTLTFRPSGSPVSVTLMKQATLTVPSSGGPQKIFTWQIPSHPAAGATRTAGKVGQLGEIPSDIPLFEGHAQTTYRLFYNLSYQEYISKFVCYDIATPTPNPPGTPSPTCYNGEWVHVWVGRSKSGEILPSQVENLPPPMDGGSVFNDYSVVIQRMDENGSTTNPKYAHRYSWGSIFYWACREGQGQVGWPNP